MVRLGRAAWVGGGLDPGLIAPCVAPMQRVGEFMAVGSEKARRTKLPLSGWRVGHSSPAAPPAQVVGGQEVAGTLWPWLGASVPRGGRPVSAPSWLPFPCSVLRVPLHEEGTRWTQEKG